MTAEHQKDEVNTNIPYLMITNMVRNRYANLTSFEFTVKTTDNSQQENQKI